MHIGRVVSTGAIGLFFMVFVAIDLVLFGVIAVNSPVVTVLMVVGLLAGGALGFLAAKRHAAT
jgi:general stress protein CsbA